MKLEQKKNQLQKNTILGIYTFLPREPDGTKTCRKLTEFSFQRTLAAIDGRVLLFLIKERISWQSNAIRAVRERQNIRIFCLRRISNRGWMLFSHRMYCSTSDIKHMVYVYNTRAAAWTRLFQSNGGWVSLGDDESEQIENENKILFHYRSM